jgi:hypothetical protein
MDPTDDLTLAQTLADYRGWRLEVQCHACRLTRHLEISELHDRLGAQTIGDVVARLVCRVCKGPGSIMLRHHMVSKWILRPS